jgi:hypothetical protein
MPTSTTDVAGTCLCPREQLLKALASCSRLAASKLVQCLPCSPVCRYALLKLSVAGKSVLNRRAIKACKVQTKLHFELADVRSLQEVGTNICWTEVPLPIKYDCISACHLHSILRPSGRERLRRKCISYHPHGVYVSLQFGRSLANISKSSIKIEHNFTRLA